MIEQKKTQAIIVYSYFDHTLGGEDYEGLTVEVPLRFGVGRRCVGISILEDSEFEENEMFQVVIEDSRISTQVAILDDGKDVPVFDH